MREADLHISPLFLRECINSEKKREKANCRKSKKDKNGRTKVSAKCLKEFTKSECMSDCSDLENCISRLIKKEKKSVTNPPLIKTNL